MRSSFSAPPTLSDQVASNTLIGLVEVVASALVSLLSVRLLLGVLGNVDYGLLTVLGASGVFASVVVTGFNSAAVRYLALAAGGESETLRRSTMASTVAIYLGITAALLLVAVAVRSSVLGALTIPPDRLDVAGIVYWTVVGQFCLGAAAAPFAAVRQAYQRFALLSVVNIGVRVLVLVYVIVLNWRPTLSDDALRSVALVMLVAWSLRFVVLVGRTLQQIPASRMRFRDVQLDQVRSIARFARWSILNVVSYQGRNQLAVVLINAGFGTVANAAYAIGLSTSTLLARSSDALNKALKPAVTSLYGTDKDRDLSGLISVGCRYVPLMSVAPLATVLVEMDNFLALWLENAPPDAALYARLITIGFFIRRLVTGYGNAISATDRMRSGTLLGGGIDAMAIAVGVVAIFVMDGPAWSLPAAIVGGNMARNLAYVSYFGPMYGFSMRRWLVEVVRPVATSFLLAVATVWLVSVWLDASLIRIALAASASLAVTAASIRWIVSTPNERALFERWLTRALT